MRIRFLSDTITREANPVSYRAGEERADFSDASCWRWIHLGLAVEIPDEPAPAGVSTENTEPAGEHPGGDPAGGQQAPAGQAPGGAEHELGATGATDLGLQAAWDASGAPGAPAATGTTGATGATGAAIPGPDRPRRQRGPTDPPG